MLTQFDISTSSYISFSVITITYLFILYYSTLLTKKFINYLELHNYIDLSSSEILKGNNKELVNRIVSSSHAILLSILSLLFWKDNNIFYYSLDNEINSIVYILIDIMIAYLVYDTIIDTIWSLPNISGTQMLIHHLLGLYSLIIIRYYNSIHAMYYLMMVFLAEISTPFLHASWIMYQLKLTKSLIYKLTGWSLLTTFFIFRIVLPPVIIVKLLKEKFIWSDDEKIIFKVLFTITVLFTILNYIWFNRLISMVLNHYKKD